MNFIIQLVHNSTSSGGDYVDRQECLSNKVTDIARRDVNCANMIAKFINATQSYDYDNDYAAAYPGAYFGYVFNHECSSRYN